MATLKVSKIDRLANFTLKKVLFQTNIISFVIFTNYFSNPPQKRYQKNNEKLKIGLEIELAISQKNVVWDVFLESDVELRKKYSLGNFQLLLKCLSDFTHLERPPWKLSIFKITSKKILWRSHRFYFWNWIVTMCRNYVENIKNIKNTFFEISADVWDPFLKKKIRLC